MPTLKMKMEGNWYLVVPESVLNDFELSPTDMMLISMIIQLHKSKGCYSSNAYFAKRLHRSTRAVTNSVKKLLSLGYLKSNTEGSGNTYCRTISDELRSYIPDPSKKKPEKRIIILGKRR